jgi:hypothetical protein
MARKTSIRTPKTFVFRKHANIGAADAIDDQNFLAESFVDNGELTILTDCSQPQCIIVGRTGSGKTALLERLLVTKDAVIKLAPEALALTYVSNNDVLNFFCTAGVNMDLFYRLLWRHVFAVEIIREHYQIVNEEARDGFLSRLRDRIFRNKARQDAIDYLLRWGASFWKDSEYRVREVTKTLEQKLGASLSGSLEGSIPRVGLAKTALNAEVAKKLSEEEKAEVIRRGQAVVDSVQMKTLSDIMDLLQNDILDDRQKRYYLTIDRLDEHWVDDELRYRLIRALLDTVRDFNNRIHNVKIIIALREDLLDRVFRYTRSPGYQEEKYRSMYLPLSWNRAELEQMLDLRVNLLVREQYTKTRMSLRDLLPDRIGRQDSLEYILARTMLRPRDAIMFLNDCIRAAEGKTKISKAVLTQAEAKYSESRLRALADEWSSDYPNLIELVLFLKNYPKQFKPIAVQSIIENSMLDFLTRNTNFDHIHCFMQEKFDDDDTAAFMVEMFQILFHVGVVGIKSEAFVSVSWSHEGQKLLGGDINVDATIYVHPGFWRVLGIQP